MPKKIIISKDEQGVKPKNFLKKKLDMSFKTLIKNLKAENIKLNGKKITGEEILKKEDIFTICDKINLREVKNQNISPKDLNIKTLYEDENFLVIDKPKGVIVQGAQDNSKSLSFHLAFLKNKNHDKSDFIYKSAHRIDKDTSGCLIVCKNQTSLRDFNSLFKNSKIEKIYYCLCLNKFDEDKKIVELYLKRNKQDSLKKVSVVKSLEKDVKKTKTQYEVLEEFEVGLENYALVKVILHTGFMHQIRITMSYLNHPIIGDLMYGNSNTNKYFSKEILSQALFAKEIKFKYLEKDFHIKSDSPKDFKNILNFFKNTK